MTRLELFKLIRAKCIGSMPDDWWGQPVTSLCTDSRRLIPGQVFAAIKGEVFDGHQYLDQVPGAAVAIVQNPLRSLETPPQWVVPDVVAALREWAKFHRQKFKGRVIAVAGSQGKTTTKELLAHLLGKHVNTLKTNGSENGYLGIPLTLLRIDHQVHDVAVVEVGIDDVGAMAQHADVVQADAVIMTGIGPEHLHQLKNLETVWQEERIILDHAIARGCPVWVNGGDSFLANSPFPAIGPFKSMFPLGETFEDSMGREWKLPLVGSHLGQNLALAVKAAEWVGCSVSPSDLNDFVGAPGRARLIRLKNNRFILDDCYNANPVSMRATLESVLAMGAKDITFVLGGMRELGDLSHELHQNLWRWLAPQIRSHHTIVVVGEEWASLGDSVRRYKSVAELINDKAMMQELSRASGVVLKGSRGIKLDLLLPHLAQRPGV